MSTTESASAPISDDPRLVMEEFGPFLDHPGEAPMASWFAGSMLLRYGELSEDQRARASAMVEENAPPNDPEVDQFLLKTGSKMMQTGLYPGTVIFFDELCREERLVSDSKITALLNRGLLYGNLGNSERAYADWESVLRLSVPGSDHYKMARAALVKYRAIDLVEAGFAHLKAGNEDEAVVCFESVLTNPETKELERAMAAEPLLKLEGIAPELREKAQQAIAALESLMHSGSSLRGAMPRWKRAAFGAMFGCVGGIAMAVVMMLLERHSDWFRPTEGSLSFLHFALALGVWGALFVGFLALFTTNT